MPLVFISPASSLSVIADMISVQRGTYARSVRDMFAGPMLGSALVQSP
jgi:hypothetical protein